MSKKEYNFQKLTPVNNADISVYEQAIDFVFENADVKNVAISGAYSAGKSSMLESYKAKHSNLRFVHLSLAHFRTPEQEIGQPEEPVKESVLEGKILNQLIHQIPSEKIPQTNFRVKKGFNKKQIIWCTAFSSLFIGSIAFLLLSSKVLSFIASLSDNWIKAILSVIFSPYVSVLAAIICGVFSVVLINSLIKAQKNKNMFRKISLQGTEIEIFETQDDSYFDKYLNEVLYLFENVDADVIVFEDMDRFNASRIFERLREVNTLVNIQRKKEHGENYTPLRFFYLLRDDIFVSKDRTKFFDYIVPIVPIVDSSNSYEQFLKHLKEGGLLERFDQSFLQSLSLYVDDMRILKNIYNEFVVYINRLNTTDLDWNKMMAIISYKNLFPRDFSDLQLAKGFVFTLFEQKPLLIEQALASAKNQRQELQDRIELAKKETLTSQEELNDAYAAKENRLPRERYYNNRLTPQGEELNKQYQIEREQRKQAIQDILDGTLPKLETKLVELEHEIATIQTKSLKSLITRDNVTTVFSTNYTNEINETNEFKEIKGSDYFDLLKFLIRSGYIDETYTDYMTYFYDDSITANDKTFLRRITDRRGAAYTYVLRDPKKVLCSPVLRVVEFEQEETLNFDLLECLLLNQTDSKYAAFLKALIAQIREKGNFDFVSKFYEANKSRQQFVAQINMQWPDFYSAVLRDKVLPSAQIRQFSVDTLCFSDDEIIAMVNVDHCLTEYISNSSNYLAIEIEDINKLVSSFQLINISFASIDCKSSNRILFDEVYKYSLYSLTFENISLMLREEYGVKCSSDIIHKNYTLVMSQNTAPLARYISENISEYMEIVLANCESRIADNEGVVVCLLNDANVEIDAKKQYIGCLSTIITDITQVSEPDLWPTLMKQQLVEFSIRNFINYFQKYGIDATLVKYINDVQAEVDFSSVADTFGEKTAERLFNETAMCNEMTNEKYKNILMDLGYAFDNFDADEIADGKFEILISEEIMQMDAESLSYVREKYAAHRFAFIQRNINEYFSLMSESIFRLDEALEIITWAVGDEQKTELLTSTDEPISVVGKQYSDIVNAYIITHNLNDEDSLHLYAYYSQYGEKTQEAITTLAAGNVNGIIAHSMEIDDILLSILIQSESITQNQKIALFTTAIPRLNEDTCKTHFDELGLSELNGIFTKASGRRNYAKTDDVTTILGALKANGWIYEYREDERNNERYVIVKNKPRGRESENMD